jgi:hypothetical protein
LFGHESILKKFFDLACWAGLCNEIEDIASEEANAMGLILFRYLA